MVGVNTNVLEGDKLLVNEPVILFVRLLDIVTEIVGVNTNVLEGVKLLVNDPVLLCDTL